MNFYQTQHEFYCGIDLHANEMYACVIDHSGKKHLHRNFKTRQADKFFDELAPFGSDVVLGCESTFNWYWLADRCQEKQIPFVLGHALYLKAIHGGKVKNDKLDSEKLATGVGQNEFLLPCCKTTSTWLVRSTPVYYRRHLVGAMNRQSVDRCLKQPMGKYASTGKTRSSN